MGNLQAREFAGLVSEKEMALEQAIAWHLRSNHYPPVDDAFVPVAVEAINLASEGFWYNELEYPNGLTRTVLDTIGGLHLGAFLNEE
jgi:hypothetical protein